MNASLSYDLDQQVYYHGQQTALFTRWESRVISFIISLCLNHFLNPHQIHWPFMSWQHQLYIHVCVPASTEWLFGWCFGHYC